MKKLDLKSFVAGILITVLVMTMVTTVFATQINKTINATYRDIKITIDGEEIVPKDVLGNIVEPFISGNNTFLPVRAVAGAVGYDVGWDDATNTVILTKKAEEPEETAEPEESDNVFIVFWGNTGNKIHINPDCSTIRNGVIAGTLEECKAAGHTEGWCGICSKDWSDELFYEIGNPNAEKYYANEEYYKTPVNEREE